MHRSEIARLNLIEILCAAPNACQNLLGISSIAANLLAGCACKFYSFACTLFGNRVFAVRTSF